MSDAPQGEGWWLASDGRYYPPESHPNAAPPAPQVAARPSPWSSSTPAGAPPTPQPGSWGSPTPAAVAPPRHAPSPTRAKSGCATKVLAGVGVGALLLICLVVVVGLRDGGRLELPDPADPPAVPVLPAAPELPGVAPIEPPVVTEVPSSETVSQRNARRKAAEYLEFMAFSRSGLIDQLEFEGFPRPDAEYGVDATPTDWNAQAAKKAAEYLEFTAFSRSGLVEQLVFEGFTPDQAEFGAASTGL